MSSMITSLATFGSLLGPDMLVIFLIVLLLFGAKKLPELARGLGQSLNEFKKAREDFESELRAGQQDAQAREAGNKQPYAAGVPAAPPAQALPYHASSEAVQPPPQMSPAALQQQVEQLQEQLRALQQQKEVQPERVG